MGYIVIDWICNIIGRMVVKKCCANCEWFRTRLKTCVNKDAPFTNCEIDDRFVKKWACCEWK